MTSSDNIFKEVSKAVNIRTVCDEYLVFNTNGFALSPFRPDEKTPSFTIHESKNRYKCFASGEYGDAIDFISFIEKISKYDAALLLIERYQLPIRPEITEAHAAEYAKQLKIYEEATKDMSDYMITYIKSRGILEDSIKRFGLGEVNGGLYIPIFNSAHKIIGYNIRNLHSEPKYINSPNSNIFTKGSVVTHLNFASQLSNHQVYVTEGQIDCIQAHQEGLSAVCCLSANLTEQQVKVISSRFLEGVLAFDNDLAGLKATVTAYESFKKFNPNFDIRVLNITGGVKDFGELLHHVSKQDLVKTHLSIYEWLRKKMYPMDEAIRLASLDIRSFKLDEAARTIGSLWDVDHKLILYELKYIVGAEKRPPKPTTKGLRLK